MLGFFQDRSPQKTRQTTLDGLWTKFHAKKNEPKQSSTPPSLTTASSATDHSSDTGDDTNASSFETSFPTMNETNDSYTDMGAKHAAPLLVVAQEPDLVMSTSTTLHETSESPDPQIRQSLDALNTEWELGTLPGDKFRTPQKATPIKGETPTRNRVAREASRLVEKTKTVLGKRSRESKGASQEASKVTKSPKRENLRTRTSEGIVKKEKPSPAEVERTKSTTSVARRKVTSRPTKSWVTQGLFAGQDPADKGNRPGSKNRAKRQSQGEANDSKKIRQYLPLPMFSFRERLERIEEPEFRLPFDIFSPLPPGQPRPEDWKKTQKSK